MGVGCTGALTLAILPTVACAAPACHASQLGISPTHVWYVVAWAQSDGGYYVSCADIAITTNGMLPDYTALPIENGGELPRNQPRRGYSCAAGAEGGALAVGGVLVIVLVVVVLVGCGVLYLRYRKSNGGGAQTTVLKQTAVGGKPAASGPAAAPSLPPGWSTAVDPASGQMYYVSALTGETRWDPPPSSQPVQPPGLPPGWTSAVDPASGQTYYVETASGATSWTVPNLVSRRV